MKVRYGAALLVVALLAAAITFTRPPPTPPEPSYAGRTLTEWLLYNPSTISRPTAREAREEAIRKIGTNALPCLLAWLAADPDHSSIKSAAHALLDELPQQITPTKVRNWAGSDMVAVHVEMAGYAFGVLGPEAAALVAPHLERLATNPRGRRGSYIATYILGGIGPQALPALQRIADNSACPTHNEARKEVARLLAH